MLLAVALVAGAPSFLMSAPFGSTLAGSGAPAIGSAAAPLAAPPAPAAHPSVSPCDGAYDEWQLLYGTGAPPPAVRGIDPGCAPAADEEGLSFDANATGAGDRFEITFALPDAVASASDARGFTDFFVQATVSGVPCSLDGRSVLQLDLLPPGSPLGGASANSWVVHAPIWDLVPAGSCDPRCENSSVLYVLGGIGFCEDNAVLQGIGSSGWPSDPEFAPGDTVRATFAGSVAGPLTVYLNDSTHPAFSTSWNYTNLSLVTGVVPGMFSATASDASGWASGGDVAAGWSNCPSASPGIGLTYCNSYDGLIGKALDFPRIVNGTYWDPGKNGYLDPYPELAPWSTSGACSAGAGVADCADFSSSGGTGVYPPISLTASGGSAALVYGPNGTDVVGALASASSGFLPNGTASPIDPALLTEVNASVNGTAITLTARATDPRGVYEVGFGAVWCFSGGSATVPTAIAMNGTRGPGPSNGSQDALWSAVFPRGSNTTSGTLYYSAREFDGPRGPGSLPVFARTPIAGPGLTCGNVIAPPLGGGGFTSLGGGYRVGWQFPSADEPMVHNFSVVAVPPGGGPGTVASVPDPSARHTIVSGLENGVSYILYLGVTLVDGTTISVGKSPGYPASTTLANLTLSLGAPTHSPLELWQPGANATFGLTAAGGLAPYSLHFDFGNGSGAWLYDANASTSLQHDFPSYEGVARVAITLNDSVGDTAAVSTLLWVRATPLGVSVDASGGDNLVRLTWSAPGSPTAPVTGYDVFYTQDPGALGALTSGWPANVSGPHPVFFERTAKHTVTVSAVNGRPLYAAVVAWDAWGAGLLREAGPVAADPAPFALLSYGAPDLGDLGGAAPFSAMLSASASSGSNDPVGAADFSVFSLDIDVQANLSTSATVNGTESWANATIPLPTAGTYRIGVHLEDALLDPELIDILSVYVGPGAAPDVSISVGTPSPFEGHPVTFTAEASGTPGPFNYTWQFGDGSRVSGNATATHAYAVGGDFTVLVTVVDQTTLGSATSSLPIEVLSNPTVRIVAAAGAGSSLAWVFQALVTGGSGTPTLAWAFGDGVSGNGQNASHTYAKPGEYTVRVTSTDPSGILSTSNLTIYAGILSTSAPSSTTSDLGVILALGAVVLVLAVTSVIFWRRSRPPKGPPPRDIYPANRLPPPRDAVE